MRVLRLLLSEGSIRFFGSMNPEDSFLEYKCLATCQQSRLRKAIIIHTWYGWRSHFSLIVDTLVGGFAPLPRNDRRIELADSG